MLSETQILERLRRICLALADVDEATTFGHPTFRVKGKMFAVNVLTEDQHDVAMRFGRSGPRKFDGVKWTPDGAGSPVIGGALTWAGCEIEAVHPGGDHNVVIGRVRELGECGSQRPLLFYRGRFATSAESGGPPEVVETLLAWPRHADWM
jgi:3-hydroxy-9,10-secoandrosta-1,3,5(10)-triene-9,17-dione monooxygenase reductase component